MTVINNRAKSKDCNCGIFWLQPYSYATQKGAKMMATKCYGQEVASDRLLTKVIDNTVTGRWHIALAPINGGCSECGKVQQALIELSHYNFALDGLNEEVQTLRTIESKNKLFAEMRKVIDYLNKNYDGDWK